MLLKGEEIDEEPSGEISLSDQFWICHVAQSIYIYSILEHCE